MPHSLPPLVSSARIRTRAAAGLAVILGALPATAAHAAADPGTLDPTFGTGGTTITAIAGRAVGASAVAQHGSTGIVVAGGALNDDSPDFLLTRYRVNGTLDQTFGTGGRVITPVPAATGAGGAEAVAVDAQLRIVAVGTAGLGTGSAIGFAVVRYLPGGALDTSFGHNGIAVVPVGPAGDAGASDVVLQPDGKIVVVGGANTATGDAVFAAVRLRTDGTLDPAFGTGGTVLVDPPGGDAAASGVTLQDDGKIVMAGTAVDASLGQQFAVVRLTAGGVPDATFGSGGIVLAQNFAGQDKGGAEAVRVDSQGRIVVAGLGETPAGVDTFGLMRLRTNGTLDPAFGGNGKVITPFPGGAGASSLLLRPNDGLIAVGSAGFPSTVALAAYLADGTLDSTFGTCGQTTTPVGPNSSGTSAAYQDGSRILVAGATFNQAATAGSFIVNRYIGFPAHSGYGPQPVPCG